ncbi:SET domain-containing protein-lysine N-methyltransferase [Sinimarinibacterium sp. NLF-5-8]|uniref:SET domain-containing protein-lysine N-methyltransferase n=1 Tax=Sinimarinibacterium sp. NLF-5-8 TaxID=2698684 RepID=UPI00137C122D|nr:SET domain-containing protein [Sinimarinibacterium sp. NLF-5-8]QHS10510.1 SET domain-containing protein [Sinimarinibacterium sp. NLF-5-8]
MILPRYHIAVSQIPDAGQGFFIDEPLARGRVLIAPDNIHTVWPESKLRTYAADAIEVESSVRWFEDQFSLTPEWSDECFVNHSFTPNALWHLGFIFARADLPAGSEITMDYRYVIGSGEQMPFVDSQTGRAIVGLPWQQVLRDSARAVAELMCSSVQA